MQIKAKPKPKPVASQPAQSIAPADCPPVLLDMALVRLHDQTRRVIAKAEDGEILAAIDTPSKPPTSPRPDRGRWA